MGARYLTIKAAHTETCQWLLYNSQYQDWLDTKNTLDAPGFLWIKGKPGSGKSTLMKFAIQNARKTLAETVIITFFFNARGEDLEKSTLGLYRSLLFQLLTAVPDLQIVLDGHSAVSHVEEPRRWEQGALQSLFEDAIQLLEQRRLICFIDALDECDEDQIREMVDFLEGLVSKFSGIHFRVCLASRHYPHISISDGIQLTLDDLEGHVQDITKYLNDKLKVGPVKQSKPLKEEILSRASGIFLWVVLVVQILKKDYDHGRLQNHTLQKRLQDIPDGLDELFEDILMKDRENMEELLLCLQWILYAKRPLKQEELYCAVTSGTNLEAMTALSDESIAKQEMDKAILSWSKGLAETTKLKAKTVQFIHESVRDFLLKESGLSRLKSSLVSDRSQERLKRCCYTYMLVDTSKYLPPANKLPVASSEEARNLRILVSEKFPFLEYAVRYVFYHADSAGCQDVSQRNFMKTFALKRWIMVDNVFEKYHVRRHTLSASMLYIVAEKCFVSLVRTQLELEPYPIAALERIEIERHPTAFAAALANVNVNEDIIRALLIHNAHVAHEHEELHNAQRDSDCSCYHAAIEKITKYRPSLASRRGQTLLHWAASEGHEAVVRLLLEKDRVNPNFKDNDGCTPLFRAASNGHETVVRLLLAENKVNPNFKDNNDQTPLIKAAINGHEAVVRLLLAKNGVNLNFKDTRGCTALWWAALNGHEAVVKLLIAKDGVNPDSRNNGGCTPLFCAASNRHEAVVRLLVQKMETT